MDGGDVLIRGGKIAAVGKGLANPGVREVDAAGRWVTPGVIDVHSHDGTFVLQLTAIDREASDVAEVATPNRSEEHTSELQSLMRISYAVFCLKKKKY